MLTYGELFRKHLDSIKDDDKGNVVDYRPSGKYSIFVWFDNDTVYEAKLIGEHFFERKLNKEEINKILGLS